MGSVRHASPGLDMLVDALDCAPFAVALYDRRDCLQHLNRRGRQLLAEAQVDVDSVIGRHWRDVFPSLGSPFEDLLAQTRRAEIGDGPRSTDVEGLGIQLTLRHLGDGVVATFFERYDGLQDALGELRAERDALIASYPFGSIASFDEHYRYLAVGGKGWADHEVDLGAMVGKSFDELWDPATVALLKPLADAALEGREAVDRVTYENQVYDVWAGPLPSKGAPKGFFVSRDVSDEVQQSRRSRILEEAANAVGVGITVADLSLPDMGLVHASRGFLRLTGYEEEEVLHRNCRFLQGEATSQVVVDAIRRAIDERRSFQGTLLNYRKDGSSFWNRLTLTPLSLTGEGVTHYAGIQEDVTAIRQSALKQEHTRRLTELGTLAGSIAHDFNNVLMEIQGRVAMGLSEEGLDEPTSRELREIGEAAKRGGRLVRQLLAYAGRQAAAKQARSESSVVRDLMQGVGRLLPARVRLEVEHPDEVLPVAMNVVHVEQILLNLARNAADAMPEGGRLKVRIAKAEDENSVVLQVSDQGMGMSPEVQERIFDRFFTTKEDGTGLGLSTVVDLVERANGSIRVDSEVGLGTTFTMYLPRASSESDAEVRRLRRRRSHRPKALEHLRILVVDDEHGIRKVLGRYLRRQGMTVTEATDGAEALGAVEEATEPFDVVLTDMDMPKMRGDALLNTIAEKFSEETDDPWLILISGDLTLARRDLPEGTIRLHKPFEMDDLLDLLERLSRGELPKSHE